MTVKATPLYEIPSSYAKLTQEQVNAAIMRMTSAYWEAETASERMQRAADAVQEMADEAERHKDGMSAKLTELVDAIRAARPDLTIPEP